MADEQEVTEVEINEDPLGDIFPDRHPLSEMGEEISEPPATEEEPKGEEEPETPAELEKKEEPTPVPVADESAGLKAALVAERRRRQELEQQITATKEPQEFDWSNPEKTIEGIKGELRQESQSRFLSMSETQCQARHEDYGEKYQKFVEMAQENPALINAMVQQADPAEYAYKLATQKMFTDEVGADPQTYRDKLKAEIRTELEAETNKKVTDKLSLAASLPPSAKSMADKVPAKDVVDNDPLASIFPGQIAS